MAEQRDPDVNRMIEALGLAPHPEGGYYRETFRSSSTAIYFLLPAGEFSAFHRLRSDEVWLAHTGSVTLELGGSEETPVTAYTAYVGTRIGQEAQVLDPAGTWQRTLPSERDALVSCLVSPGFDFADFELEP